MVERSCRKLKKGSAAANNFRTFKNIMDFHVTYEEYLRTWCINQIFAWAGVRKRIKDIITENDTCYFLLDDGTTHDVKEGFGLLALEGHTTICALLNFTFKGRRVGFIKDNKMVIGKVIDIVEDTSYCIAHIELDNKTMSTVELGIGDNYYYFFPLD